MAGHEVFSDVTVGRASLFHGVTEWGTPSPAPHHWEQERSSKVSPEAASAPSKLIPSSEDREQRRGEACPP